MMGYHWYFNDNESKCYLTEWYADGNGILAHHGNIGEILGKPLEVSTITRFELFGDLNEEVAKGLEPKRGTFGNQVFRSLGRLYPLASLFWPFI